MRLALGLRCAVAVATACLSPHFSVAADNDRATASREANLFAADLYGRVRQRPGNIFFSPESIATALAMTLAGARGDTATEMTSVLRVTLPPDRLQAALGSLLRERNAPHDGYHLAEADALWGQTGYSLRPDFLGLVRKDYGADLTPLDFKTDAEAARQTINRWVAGKTENKIVDLIAPGILTADTRLVLTNALYFKAGWATPFETEATSDEQFQVAAGRNVVMRAMHRTGAFNYLDGGAFQALELPYRGDDLSMVVFLPKAADGLAGFEQARLDQKLPTWLGELSRYPTVIVTLPKFTVRATVSLKPVLEVMGMKHAFDRAVADFSGMTGAKDFVLSAVLHQAFVAIDENGTEAAAATAAVVVAAGSMRQTNPPPPIVFRADHPFLFLIRENRSGIILFMGRVADPSA